MRLKNKNSLVFLVLAGVILGAASLSFLPQEIKAKITSNSVAKNLLPAYRSVKKAPDFLFLPYAFFADKLPALNLTIRPEEMFYMNSFLPENPFTSISSDENKVFVKAFFEAPDFPETKVDIRYKGLNPDHWNGAKKSYRIKFPDGGFFEGAKFLNLTIPVDKGYYSRLLSDHRADKFGLLSKNADFMNVNINGRSLGVYIVSEHWSKELLEKERWPDDSAIFGLNDGSPLLKGHESDYPETIGNLFYDGRLEFWKSYTDDRDFYEELDALLKVITYADDETFKMAAPLLIDMNSFYGWNALMALAGNEGVNYENVGLLFNTATGKFEMLPVDAFTYSASWESFSENSTIAKRILAIEEFREARDGFLGEYLKDEENLKDDLDFYDRVDEESRKDFLKDWNKKDTNFSFLREIKDARQSIIDNFYGARTILGASYPPKVERADLDKLVFSGSFERFSETFAGINEFLRLNPRFLRGAGNAVILPAGPHTFTKTVIIPRGLKLTIEPGTTVYMSEKTSFISYSPVEARASAANPIRFLRASVKPWGAFAVVGAGSEKSIIEGVQFNGGSGDKINGITFTGMASFHDSNADVINSSFINAADDDGLNIKYGLALVKNSYFAQNYSDGIDVDFGGPETRILDNVFLDNGYGEGGGDGIDISWSDILIEGNKVSGCADKGISVGESSRPTIRNNEIEKCDIGIAVKDSSEAEIIGNIINNVRVGVSAYQKKEVFGGGKAFLSENIIKNALLDYEKNKLSLIEIK